MPDFLGLDWRTLLRHKSTFLLKPTATKLGINFPVRRKRSWENARRNDPRANLFQDGCSANRNEDSNYDNESERYSGGAEAWSEEEDVESPVAELYDDDTTDAKQEVERWSQDDSPQEAEPDLPRQESSHKIYQRQSSQSPQIARATSPTIKVTTQTSLQRADTWSEFEASQELDRAEPGTILLSDCRASNWKAYFL